MLTLAPETLEHPLAESTQTNHIVLEAQHLKREFIDGGNVRTILADASIRLYAGEVVALVGRSGSGKSTLLNILGLLDKPTAGELSVLNQPALKLTEVKKSALRAQSIGFIFQHYCLMQEFNVLENLMMRAQMACSPLAWWRSKRKLAQQRAEQLLVQVGLKDQMRQPPLTLSGGERQRVAVARALMTHPRILLCDEPTGNLDQETGERIMTQIFDLCRGEQVTALIVTHDRAIAQRADRVLRMETGCLHQDTLSSR